MTQYFSPHVAIADTINYLYKCVCVCVRLNVRYHPFHATSSAPRESVFAAALSQLGHLNMISDVLFRVMALLYVQTWPEYVYPASAAVFMQIDIWITFPPSARPPACLLSISFWDYSRQISSSSAKIKLQCDLSASESGDLVANGAK